MADLNRCNQTFDNNQTLIKKKKLATSSYKTYNPINRM